MKRHTITLGASTTAGGKVISASSAGSINGVTIALENDMIFCPTCRSQGKIKCVGPRIPETWDGKNVALENDLCLCGCPNPPHLLPDQSLRYQTVGETPSGASHVTGTTSPTPPIFDDKYILIDTDTGEPLIRAEYALRRANGQFEFGTTDKNGHTHILASTAQAETIEIYS